jgi:hypothetical protein
MLSVRNHQFVTMHVEFPLTSSVVFVGCRSGDGHHIAIICKSTDSMNKEVGRNIREKFMFMKIVVLNLWFLCMQFPYDRL